MRISSCRRKQRAPGRRHQSRRVVSSSNPSHAFVPDFAILRTIKQASKPWYGSRHTSGWTMLPARANAHGAESINPFRHERSSCDRTTLPEQLARQSANQPISQSETPAPLERQNAQRNVRALTERPPLVRQDGNSNLPRLREPDPERTAASSGPVTHGQVAATAEVSREARLSRRGIDPRTSNLPTIKEE